MTDKSGKLSISKTPNAVVPVVEGKSPILTVDVWEHVSVHMCCPSYPYLSMPE